MSPPLDTTVRAGYSAQADLSLRIADQINSGRMNLYFATELNPANNVTSANPLEIFLKLDRVSRGGAQPPDLGKIETTKRNPRLWVLRTSAKGSIDPKTRNEALHGLKTADRAAWKPVLMRLTGIIGAAIGGEADEFIARAEPWREKRILDSSEIGVHLAASSA